jgi:peptidyl-prolyl cis-trans isomerase SurA
VLPAATGVDGRNRKPYGFAMKRTFASALLIAPLIACIAGAGPARAQQMERIAAVVNDEVISFYDLGARLDLVVVTGRLPDSAESRRRIAPQVLRALVNERLQMQEAKKRSISVSDQEIRQAVANLERDNKIPPGQLEGMLKQQNVQMHTLIEQIRASIAWSKLIRRQFRQEITIGDEEIEEVLNRIKTSQGQTEFRVAEIFLSVDAPDEEAEALRTARRLVSEIRGGAEFDALARQFSQSATAAVGGDLGWVSRGELEDDVSKVIDQLKRGEVSEPVRRPSGYQLLLVRDVRQVGSAKPEDIKISLQQVFVPVSAGAGASEVAARKNLAQSLSGKTNGCPAFEAAARESGSSVSPKLENLTVADLNPNIRDTVRALKVGSASQPLTLNSGFLLLMVCERTEPPPAVPNRDDIAEQLRNERLSMLARRYLRDLRLAAIVDIRA